MAATRALVTGANGFVGSHLVDELLARGRSVRALVRASSDLSFLDPRAERRVGDVLRPRSLLPALEGAEEVYHVAGVVAARRLPEYAEVNVAGTRSLALAARRQCPRLRRFLLVSSAAAGGPSRTGRPVKESDRPRPVSIYGRSKLAGERVLQEVADGMPTTIVRPPFVYGPRDTGMLNFFRMVVRGRVPRFPREKLHTYVHVRDLVRGIVDAAESPRAVGRVYNLAEGRSWASSAVLGMIAGTLGARPRPVTVRGPVLRLVSPVLDHVTELFGLDIRPMRDKHREILARFWTLDVSRARRELGFVARIPLPEGLRESAAFYREAGWIPRADVSMVASP
jgi:nucleoside-diphosphate-sugar epimerase